MTVVANTDDKRPEGVVVYNFAVEDNHTYFVNDGVGDGWAWVHNNCVYIGRDKITREITYVGKAAKFSSRKSAHKAAGRSFDVERLHAMSDHALTPRQASALEQVLIFKYGGVKGGKLENAINGIRATKLKGFTADLQWAMSYLKTNGVPS